MTGHAEDQENGLCCASEFSCDGCGGRAEGAEQDVECVSHVVDPGVGDLELPVYASTLTWTRVRSDLCLPNDISRICRNYTQGENQYCPPNHTDRCQHRG